VTENLHSSYHVQIAKIRIYFLISKNIQYND